MKKSILKKLEGYYKLGYIPSRKTQTYHYTTKNECFVAQHINCFGHACLNLTNEMVEDFNVGDLRKIRFAYGYTNDPIDATKNTFKFLKKIGLDIKVEADATRELKPNEWRVAYYLDLEYKDYMSDFHFMLQESENCWSSKQGSAEKLCYFEEPPKFYDTHLNHYRLATFIIISNPYALKSCEEKCSQTCFKDVNAKKNEK